MARAFSVRFSLRFKLISVLLTVMILILVLSNALFYWSTKDELVKDAVQQNKLVSEQINLEIIQSQQGETYIDHLLGNELRVAAVAAKYALPKDAANVTNAQLVQLSKELGISDITLLQPTKTDIVGVKSSDPKEIGLSTKGMGAWYLAFQDLLKGIPPNPSFGLAGPHYWSGPFANASSNPSKVDKWGYFYDGSTNYIIDPYIESESISDYTKYVSAGAFIDHIQKSEPEILSIAVLNKTFGSKPIQYSYQGSSWVDVANQPIMYGTYAYQNRTLDVADKNRAYQTNQVVSATDVVHGTKVLKTFIPETVNHARYVVEVVTNYSVVSNTLHQAVKSGLGISLILLIIIMVLSYVASEFLVRPLRRITATVDQIASRNFQTPVAVHRTDEIGLLASRVNAMSQNIVEFLHDSIRKERGQGVDYLVMTTHALVHELGNPLVAIKYLTDFLPKVQPDLNEKGQEVISRMRTASEYANRVVREFSEFLKNGRLHFQKCEVTEIVEEAVSLSRPLADSSQVVIEMVNEPSMTPILAEVDKDKLLMALVNLMKNGIDAIDDTQVNRMIHVEVSMEENDIQIDVSDTGHGIPEDQWESIFLPYSSTKKNGLGLGLTFSGFVVLAHGGIIQVVESGPSGTTMRLTLPLKHKNTP